MQDPEQTIRDALVAERRRRGMTVEDQRRLLGVPRSTLNAFLWNQGPGRHLNDRMKAAIARAYPQLIPELMRLSLRWMPEQPGPGEEPPDTDREPGGETHA